MLKHLPSEIVDHIFSIMDYKNIFNTQILPLIQLASKIFYERQNRSRPVQILSTIGGHPMYCILCYCQQKFCSFCKQDEHSHGTGIIVWINLSEFTRFCDKQFLSDTPIYLT
jgi:hypothetical protein